MKQLIVLGVVVSLFAASTAAFALPTIGSVNETTILSVVNGLASDDATVGGIFTFTGGATGGLQVPTADVQTGMAVSIDRSELEVARIPSVRFLAGVAKGIEVGAGYEDIRVMDNTLSTWNVNAKYALPISALGANLAVGANYNKFDTDSLPIDASSTNIYLAGTLPVQGDAKVSANVTYSMLDSDVVDSNGFAFGLGYEKAFDNDTAAGVELIANAGDFEGTNGIIYGNVYVNVPISDKLVGRAALSGIGQFTTTDFGVTMNF